jgi:polysaccharide biosynthesis protein PslH
VTARPKIVFLSSRFPFPVDRGDRVRTHNLIRQFSRHAAITLVSFCEGPVANTPRAELLEHCERVEVVPLSRAASRLNMLAAIPGSIPFQVAYYHSEQMHRIIEGIRREPWALAFGHLFRVRPYLDRFTGVRRIIDLSDSLAMNLGRAAATKPPLARQAFHEELRRVERYESESLLSAEECWVVAEPDRRDLLRRAPTAKVETIPMGVDARWGDEGLSGPKEDAVLFLGNLTVGHNIDAAKYLVQDIWPQVRRHLPGARLHLVGRHSASVARLGHQPGVRLEGFVEDLRPFLSSCRLSVAPLRYGAGVQTKVIETMAAGLPAVVTPIVAEPVGAEPDREILIGSTSAEVATQIIRLLRSPEEARRIGAAGQAQVRARFRWERAGERLAELLGL